jgi:hypothetical protein
MHIVPALEGTQAAVECPALYTIVAELKAEPNCSLDSIRIHGERTEAAALP